MLLPSGNPFKCHEEVLSLQPMIPPKRFDIFPPDWGMLRRSRCFQIFLEIQCKADSYARSKMKKTRSKIGRFRSRKIVFVPGTKAILCEIGKTKIGCVLVAGLAACRRWESSGI